MTALAQNKVIITPFPQGRFLEGTISGALTPGVCVEISAITNGKFTFRAYQPGSDGLRPLGGLPILIENLRGGDNATAYVTGEGCRVYFPLHGDVLIMILQDVSGTADAHTFGELLIPDTGTGKLIATTGSPEIEPFTLCETLTAPAADVLGHVIYTGY